MGNHKWPIQRHTDNIGYTKHRIKTNKTKNTTKKTKMLSNTDPSKITKHKQEQVLDPS